MRTNEVQAITFAEYLLPFLYALIAWTMIKQFNNKILDNTYSCAAVVLWLTNFEKTKAGTIKTKPNIASAYAAVASTTQKNSEIYANLSTLIIHSGTLSACVVITWTYEKVVTQFLIHILLHI